MVGIFTMKHLDVQVHAGTVGYRIEKFTHQFCVKTSGMFCGKVTVKDEIGSAG